MGGLCSKNSAVGKSPSDTALGPNGLRGHEEVSDLARNKKEVKLLNSEKHINGLRVHEEVSDLARNKKEMKLLNSEKHMDETQSVQSRTLAFGFIDEVDSAPELEEPQLLRTLSERSRSTRSKLASSAKTGATKVSEVSSIFGKAGTVGLGKAVEVIDTLGSSMTNLHLSGSFIAGGMTKGTKISILAFEVANTIVKGANLMQSLSKENTKHLKEVVLQSEAVQQLISRDIDELLRIAAADKREELEVFSREVVRFGNQCKDPQWHNLDRYFNNLALEFSPQNHLKEATETVMEQLMTSVQYTSELYHEMHTLDRFEQDYKRKNQEEDSTNASQKVENLQILRQDLKSQSKHVKSLKKRSLWSKNLEEVLEKLVDIVHSLHLEIHNAFGKTVTESEDTSIIKPLEANTGCHKRLGPAGLALHYANIISQMDTLASRPCSVPPNTRDTLYQGLPPSVKNTVRSKLHSFQANEEVSVGQIKEKMEKVLRWLVPMANNTTKAHHGFGWVGEWANTGTELNRKPAGQADLIRIETLYHADKEKTDLYILDLVVWLHLLISHSRSATGGVKSPIKSPIPSPTQKGMTVTVHADKSRSPSSMLTKEDEEMLHKVNFRRLIPGISKSQEFDTEKSRKRKLKRLSMSNSHSPTNSSRLDIFLVRRPSMLPVIDFDSDKVKALDVIDRVYDVGKL